MTVWWQQRGCHTTPECLLNTASGAEVRFVYTQAERQTSRTDKRNKRYCISYTTHIHIQMQCISNNNKQVQQILCNKKYTTKRVHTTTTW